ncbi:hypothetical protein JCM8208_001370 [Rhodotorula glutinis]
MHVCTPTCLEYTTAPSDPVTPARQPRPPSPPLRPPFLATTLPSSTVITPLLDPPTCDYFPSVYLSDDDPARSGLAIDVDEWDLSTSESAYRPRSPAVDLSPLDPSASLPPPPVAIRCSTVVSCLGRIEDGMCGVCRTWVVAAVTWTLPGEWSARFEPDWSRWYTHAQECHVDPHGPALAPSSPSSSTLSPSPYKPLFRPPFDAPPSLITHMPPLLFLSPPYPDWSALVQPTIHLSNPSLHLPEPSPHLPDTLVPPLSLIKDDEPSDHPADEALQVRVLEWRRVASSSVEPDEPAQLRDSTTEALAAVWGSAEAPVEPVDEADKENAPPAAPGGGGRAGKTPKYGFRTRTKRRATELLDDSLGLGTAPPLPPSQQPATPAPPPKRRKSARA